METYWFTLTVEGTDFVDGEVVDALYEAGCDDAMLGVTNGVPQAMFAREAPSMEEAVRSAIADVESVGGIKVVGFSDDSDEFRDDAPSASG